MNRLRFILIPLINLLVILLMVNGAVEIPLSKGWTIINQNGSKQLLVVELIKLNTNHFLRHI